MKIYTAPQHHQEVLALLKQDHLLTGVFGDPLFYNLAPPMFHAAIQEQELAVRFLAFKVSERELGPALDVVRDVDSWKGIMLLRPHGVAALPFIDHLDWDAELAGSVNVVVPEPDGLVGYNTDVTGFRRAVVNEYLDSFHDVRAVVIGAGATGRSIITSLIRGGASYIAVINRTLRAAKDICEHLGKAQRDLKAFSLTTERMQNLHHLAPDIIINATSLGYGGIWTDECAAFKAIPFDKLEPKTLFVDLNHDRRPTPFLAKPRELGFPCLDGLEMTFQSVTLVHRLWFGMRPPEGSLRRFSVQPA